MDINNRNQRDEVTKQIIGSCIEVHKALGPGLLESAYEECLCRELDLRGLVFSRQKELPVEYKGIKLNCGYRLDIVVEDSIIFELKAVESFHPIHEAQLLTYLKISGMKLGYLLNFNVHLMRKGIKRMVLNLKEN